jgi:colanic acid/amylovoran biosynthesis protein
MQLLIPCWLHRPYGVYASSIGPYKADFKGRLATIILNRARFVLLREDESLTFVEEMGVWNPEIHLTIDAAFNLSVAPLDYARSVLHNLLGNQEFPKPLVGMTVHNWDFPNLPRDIARERSDVYFRSIISLVDYITGVAQGYVIFLPQNVEDNLNRNVPYNARAILGKARDPDRVICIDQEFTPEILKSIYYLMDFCVVSHMHGLIYSVSSCCPTLAYAYEPKFIGMMRRLELLDYLLNMYEMGLADAVGAFKLLQYNALGIRSMLGAKLENIKSLSDLNESILKKHISNVASVD